MRSASAVDVRAGARLQRLIPHSRRVILTNSGHAAMLETSVSIYKVLRRAQVLPWPGVASSSDDEQSAASTAPAAQHSCERNGSLQHVPVPVQQTTSPEQLQRTAASAADQGQIGAHLAAANSLPASERGQSSTSNGTCLHSYSGEQQKSSNGSQPHVQHSSQSMRAQNGDRAMHNALPGVRKSGALLLRVTEPAQRISAGYAGW